jgi:hypothetical protein
LSYASTVNVLALVSAEPTATSTQNNEEGSKQYRCQRSCNSSPTLAGALPNPMASAGACITPNNHSP